MCQEIELERQSRRFKFKMKVCMGNTLDLVETGWGFNEQSADCIRSSGSMPVKNQCKRK